LSASGSDHEGDGARQNYPHLTWILDDGARDEVLEKSLRRELGVGYITREVKVEGISQAR
jgi:hypothetical protein